MRPQPRELLSMRPQPRELLSMRPQPRELLSIDISLYKSLGIVLNQALLLIVMVTSTAPTEAMNSIAFTSANPISSSARTADAFLRYGGKCFRPHIGTENVLVGGRRYHMF